MASTAASAVFAAARVLYDAVQQVKANKRQARLIADRVQAIIEPVRAFDAGRLGKAETQDALTALLAVISDASAFVDDFRETGRLKRTIFRTGHADRFAELNMRLSHAAQALTLGAVLSLHFNSSDDVRAQTSDRVQDKNVLGVWAISPTLATFIGREAELARLAELLHPPASARAPARRLAISGMGGAGKSTLAQWAAVRCADRFTSGWVVDGSNLASLHAGLRALAADMGHESVNLDQLPRIVRALLGKPECAGWLLIVDNVDDIAFAHALPALLPDLGGCLLVTSRLAHWDREEWAMITLGTMATEEAMMILQQTSTDAEDSTSKHCRQVAEVLGGLPLALSQARMLVRRMRLSWSVYLSKLEGEAEAPAVLTGALPSLQLSLRAAVQELPECALVLQLLQALHPDDVPRAVLADALKRIVGAIPGAAVDLEDALALLADCSIITMTAQFVSTHRLMQKAMAAVAPLGAAALAHLSEAMNAGTSFRSTGTYDADPQTSALLALHYPAVLSKLEALQPDSLAYADALFGHLQVNIMTRGDGWLAMAQRCLDLYDRLLEDSDIRKAPVFVLVGGTLSQTSSCREGLALAMRFRQAVDAHYPSHAYFSGWATGVIAFGLYNVASYKEAMPFMLDANTKMTSLLGEDHPTVAMAAWSYGRCCACVGDYPRQLALNERAVPVQLRRYGPKNWYPLYSAVCVNDSVCELGNVARGLEGLRAAVATLDENYGDGTLLANSCRTFLAKAYGRCGSWAAQLASCERAYAYYVHSADHGPATWKTAALAVQLADAYGALGRADKQRELAESALQTLANFFTEGHIELARAYASHGEAAISLGDDVDRGVERLAQALAVFEEFFGADHVETARLRTRLARGLVADGQIEVAHGQLERALAAQEAFFKDGHGDTAQTLWLLARVHDAIGKQDARRACLERALRLFEQHYGENHAMVGRVLVDLAALEEPGSARAGPLLVRAVATLRVALGADHAETACAATAAAAAALEPAGRAAAGMAEAGAAALAPTNWRAAVPTVGAAAEGVLAEMMITSAAAAPAPPAAVGPSPQPVAAAPVESWTVADVVAWLRRLDLGAPDEAVAAFERAGIRGRHLPLLTDERIARLGVGLADGMVVLEERDQLVMRR